MTIWTRVRDAALVLTACAGLGGCAVPELDVETMAIEVHLVACVRGVQQCYRLGLPDAEVTLLNPAGARFASGTTGADGRLTLDNVPYTGPGRAVIRSPLIEGGVKEASFVVPPGGLASFTVRAPLTSRLERRG